MQNNMKIAWKGLSEGLHQFDYEVDNKFFASIEYSEITEGNLQVQVDLIRSSQMMTLNFYIDGYVNSICDRCLEAFDLDIEFESDLIVKIGSETAEIDDNIISIDEADDILDLTHYIYESIILSLPYKKVHPDDEDGNSTCNNEMLDKIGFDNDEKKTVDPRWDALSKLKK